MAQSNHGDAAQNFDTAQGSGTEQEVIGPTAADSALTANPVTVGGRASTSAPATVADGDVVNIALDDHGCVRIASLFRGHKLRQCTTITSSTAETDIIAAAGGVGVYLDLYRLVIANTSAVACNVTIRDLTTGGSAVYIFAVPAGQTVGFSGDWTSASKQTTAANKWTAQCSASVASIVITAEFALNTA
jgi:hypothetical protein